MKPAVLLPANRALITLPAGNDHPVVDLPFIAVIDGRQFQGRGLSLVAAYVTGLMDPAVANTTRIVRLMFQFDGFSVSLVVDAEVRDGAAGSGEAELVFAHPTGPHLPQLRHILNAFIAGDLVGLGQAIGVAGTAAPKGPRAEGLPESGLSFSRVVRGTGLGLLTVALIGIAGTLAYRQIFVTLLPTPGTVVSTGEVLRATTTGQIVFLDPAATKGAVVVAIQAASGDVQSLVMPCDCTVLAQGMREGTTVLIGEPVVQLASEADERLVAAAVPPSMLFDFAAADRIELRFPGGATATATAEPARAGVSTPGDEALAILLRPEPPLAASQIGQPVEIRILRDTGGFVARLRSGIANLFGSV